MKHLRFIILAVMSAIIMGASAQIVTEPVDSIDPDSVRRAYDKRPFFGLYKDNYFIFGPALNTKPTNENTNVKFQISISHRITNTVLPFGTYLYLFYTQKVFWNVLQNSLPMTDLNFNPGIGLAKPLFIHDKYIGKVTLIAEHESNGRDGDASRSWNKLSLAGSIMIDPNIMVHGKIWLPLIDGKENRDICKYAGIWQSGVQLRSDDGRFNAGVTLVKRGEWNLRYNAIIEVGMRLWKNANEYLFMQFYRGYGEGLLDYKQFHCQLRVGIQIRPNFFSEY